MLLPVEKGKNKFVFKTNAMAPARVDRQDGAHPPRCQARSPRPACGPGRALARVPATQADPGGGAGEPRLWRVLALLDRRPHRVSPVQPPQAVSLRLVCWFPGSPEHHVWGGGSSEVLPAVARFAAHVWLHGPQRPKLGRQGLMKREGCSIQEAGNWEGGGLGPGAFPVVPFSPRAFLRGMVGTGGGDSAQDPQLLRGPRADLRAHSHTSF